MKILDRYVVGSFLRNYLISFAVLVGMYVVLDMIFNFDELVEVNTKQGLTGLAAFTNFIRYTADYYFYQSFLYFLHLAGIIPIVAAAFTLVRMVRFNELSALLSAGVPMLRIALPIILVALMLNGLLWVDQEMFLPNMIPKLIRKHDYGADVDFFPISIMRDEHNAKLSAARFYPATDPPAMEHVDIIEVGPDNEPLGHVSADRATWDAAHRRWKLETHVLDHDTKKPRIEPGRHDVNLVARAGRGAGARSEPIEFYQSDITPEEIQLYRNTQFVELLSTSHINELLKRPQSYGHAALLRVKHFRGAAQISVNMILLLLAISSVMTREPQQVKLAVSRCVFLCGACLTAAVGAQALADRIPLTPALTEHWPMLMAWLPVFTFGPFSIWLLDRMKT